MTTDNNTHNDEPDTQEVDAAPTRRKTLPIFIQKQYVKDISFESPNAPQILNVRGRPEMEISFNMNAEPIERPENEDDDGDYYEVTVGLEARAKRGEKLAFLTEILYGMQVKINKDMPENKRHAMLYIEVPRYAFPYVRQILTNLTQMGGFPPLLLTPIDFKALYMDRFGQQAEIQEGGQAEEKEQA